MDAEEVTWRDVPPDSLESLRLWISYTVKRVIDAGYFFEWDEGKAEAILDQVFDEVDRELREHIESWRAQHVTV